MSAIDMCREGKLSILVFNFKRDGNIERAIAGQPIGTLVTDRSKHHPESHGPRTMNSAQILKDAEERMEKAVNVLANALKGIRTGRANPGLVDSVRVEYYGSPTPLKQIANISVPEPQQILIRPFDTSILEAIAKAITASELGMVPNNDGRVIRLNVPPLLLFPMH